MSAIRLAILVTVLLAANTADALNVRTSAIRNQSVFGISFPGEGQSYYGKEGNVQSISLQEYITATFKVLEINIVTEGSALLRIYHSRPLEAGELVNKFTEAARSTGAPGSGIIRSPLPPNVESMINTGVRQTSDSITDTTVVKEYPIATHARTIEFRISSSHELLDLYDELRKHWIREPAFYKSGQIVDSNDGSVDIEEKPRALGGVLFVVE